MSVQFRCPCGTTLRANSSVAGKKISCPKCGKQLLVKPSQANGSPDPRAVTEDDNIEEAEDDDRTTSRTDSNMQKPSPKPAYSSTRSVSPPSPTSSTTYQFPSTDFPKPARGTLSGSNKSGDSARLDATIPQRAPKRSRRRLNSSQRRNDTGRSISAR